MTNITRRAALTGGIALTATPVIGLPRFEIDPAFSPNVAGDGAISACRFLKYIADKSMPVSADLKGVQFKCLSGEIVLDSIWATAMTDDYRLIHMRPAVFNGWREGRSFGDMAG